MTELVGLITRSNLKGLIMTSNYNAGYKTCLQNFLEKISDSPFYNEANSGVYRDFIKKFHKFLEEKLFNIIYTKDKQSFLCSERSHLTMDDAKLSLLYYHVHKGEQVIKIQNQRWVFIKYLVGNNVVDWKTDIALNANIIQAYDAELARRICKNVNV